MGKKSSEFPPIPSPEDMEKMEKFKSRASSDGKLVDGGATYKLFEDRTGKKHVRLEVTEKQLAATKLEMVDEKARRPSRVVEFWKVHPLPIELLTSGSALEKGGDFGISLRGENTAWTSDEKRDGRINHLLYDTRDVIPDASGKGKISFRFRFPRDKNPELKMEDDKLEFEIDFFPGQGKLNSWRNSETNAENIGSNIRFEDLPPGYQKAMEDIVRIASTVRMNQIKYLASHADEYIAAAKRYEELEKESL